MTGEPDIHLSEALQETLRLWLSAASLTEIRSLLELVQAELYWREVPFAFTLPEEDRPGGPEEGGEG